MEDIVHFTLSREARKGIEILYRANDWEDIEDKTWLSAETLALMFFRLRAAKDDPEIFPRGKWATVQALEAIVDGAFCTRSLKDSDLER